MKGSFANPSQVDEVKHPLIKSNETETAGKVIGDMSLIQDQPSSNTLLSLQTLRNLMDYASITNCRPGVIWLAVTIVLQSGQLMLVSETTHSLGAVQALLIRSYFLLCTVFFISWRKSESYGWIEMANFTLIGLGDSLYVLFAGLASYYIWSGDFSAIALNLPIPCSMLACIIFGEAIDVTDGFLAFLNACGLTLVSQPTFLFQPGKVISESSNTQTLAGFLLAGASLASSVSATLACRSIAYRKADNVFLIATLTGLIGTMFSSFAALMTSSFLAHPTNLHDWLFTFALGICAIGALCSYAKALETEHVLTVTVFLTLTIPINNLFDFILLGRDMNWLTVFGITLILASTFIMYIKTRCRSSS